MDENENFTLSILNALIVGFGEGIFGFAIVDSEELNMVAMGVREGFLQTRPILLGTEAGDEGYVGFLFHRKLSFESAELLNGLLLPGKKPTSTLEI